MFGLTENEEPTSSVGRPDGQASGGRTPPDEREIAALVTLLERESKPANLAVIRARLEELGPDALPQLDVLADRGATDAAAQAALYIRRRALGAEWARWVDDSHADLESGVLLIDRFGDPLRAALDVTRRLDALADDLGRRIAGADADEALSRLRTFLFSELGFRGNSEAYEDPENSYLSCVLSRRLGIPVSLSVVVMLLAQRLGLPIVGIGMPGHFLVRYGTQPSGPYLDAFGGGRLLSREDCVSWLRTSGFSFDPRMLLPVGPRYIVARMLRNLVATFSKRDGSPEVHMLAGYLKQIISASESGTSVGAEARPRDDHRPG